jgi:hypothetical protein
LSRNHHDEVTEHVAAQGSRVITQVSNYKAGQSGGADILSLRGAKRRGNLHRSAQRDGDCFAALAMTGKSDAMDILTRSPDCPELQRRCHC